MIMFDADNIMSGARLVNLVRLVEQNPQVRISVEHQAVWLLVGMITCNQVPPSGT